MEVARERFASQVLVSSNGLSRSRSRILRALMAEVAGFATARIPEMASSNLALDAGGSPHAEQDTLVNSLISLLDKAGREIEGDAEMAKLTIRRASSILRIEMERRTMPAEKDSSFGELAPWQVSRVRTYIDAHLADRIHVKDLSHVARRSTAHFCRAFKRTMGETPHSYVTRRRVDEAGRLMLTGDAPLSEIALLCGFSDQAHFCNRFRLATGQSPAAWRRERIDGAGRSFIKNLQVAASIRNSGRMAEDRSESA
jgi:AraC family transcriptional regulator